MTGLARASTEVLRKPLLLEARTASKAVEKPHDVFLRDKENGENTPREKERDERVLEVRIDLVEL